ncbi:PEP-CTERM sorting domain-containing protein [Dasania sp. GY-MA-18]|uniref:PEP-CTERM sorting domain-containing protein n=1 Tax=Dasania phycosphaerae TaxID=2950436 RepID=A0A9J6RPN2_9GAMM|nr:MULTISPECIES: PEP-CTERM sorting domain-containing protein [Dasania]MCR8923831.1 PEP-CTERM sorting domain-containing protein [Dasania sp. GY-MA-18]MCZ0866265.1 PEP-CTERM sorting domain-containing protein [Dasania phycosphaerae]MCZ0869989.1 PEP-CTERM sorting domain-containing protein [Dasania phycosphaerae]
MKALKLSIAALGLIFSLTANAIVISGPTAGTVYSDNVDLITGGVVNGNLGLNGFGYTANIYDGLITGDLGVLNGINHTANIMGGSIANDIRLNGIDHIINITGGSFGGEFFTNGFDSIVTVTGYGLSVLGNFNSYAGAQVTGFLSDGSAINNIFRSNGSGHVLNIVNTASVSEPSTIGLLLMGLVVTAVARVRKS